MKSKFHLPIKKKAPSGWGSFTNSICQSWNSPRWCGKICHDDQQKRWISIYFQVFVKIWVNLYSKQTDLPGVSSALTRIHIPTKTVWIVAAIVSVKSDSTSFWGKCMSLHIQCSTIMYIWCNTCKWRPNACTAELLCVYLICAVY